MISKESEALILRYFHVEKWRVGTIANQLNLHHSTVQRVLAQASALEPKHTIRASMVDPFMPFIMEQLDKFPTLTAARLFYMVQERGYPGVESHFRRIIGRVRPKPKAKAYLRLRPLIAEQAQVDWGSFGKLQIGRAQRDLSCFVMVLSWSRMVYLRFFLNQRMPFFLKGHLDAFEFFGGVPRRALYDNLKSAVLERRGDAIVFNPELLELCAHYRFEPRPVAPARGNEKGRVERAIRYVRHAFFAARDFEDVEDLNKQALVWCQGQAADRRCPENQTMSVREAFEQEQHSLISLPDNRYPWEERLDVSVEKTPYIRFDLNDYSVPHDHVNKSLTVVASEHDLRILKGRECVAEHPRSYDRDQQIENPDHVAALVEEKREAREERSQDRLYHVAPRATEIFVRLAQRGHPLGAAAVKLIEFLDSYGAAEFRAAIDEALVADTPHPSAILKLLETRRAQTSLDVPLPVVLPDDPRIQDLAVKPHDLANYDQITSEEDDDA